jgi:hypothetical protein
MVAEIKRQYNERKNYLLATFGYANYKVSITSDISKTDKHDLGYSCVTAYYIDENWILQKKSFKFSYHGIFAYCTNYLSIYY